MELPPPPPQSKEVKLTEEDNLFKQYKSLELEWANINQSSKPRRKTLQRSSTDSTTVVNALQHLDSSPRKLMSSLQARSKSRSPLEGKGTWKIRTNDLATEEILRERKTAIEGGKLKGRRLFEDLESVCDMGYGSLGAREGIICSGWDDLVQESEVGSVCSYGEKDNENFERKEGSSESPHCYSSSSSFSLLLSSPSNSSFLCEECMGREMAVVSSDKEKKSGVTGFGAKYGKRWIVKFKDWLVIGLFVCVIGMIVMKRFVGDKNECKVILVPT